MEFDENDINEKGKKLAARYSATYIQELDQDDVIEIQINSFHDGARWQFNQDKVQMEKLKEYLRMMKEIGVDGQRRINDEAWEKNKKLTAELEKYKKALELCKEQRDLELTYEHRYAGSLDEIIRDKNKEIEEVLK